MMLPAAAAAVDAAADDDAECVGDYVRRRQGLTDAVIWFACALRAIAADAALAEASAQRRTV